jgi:protein TonB
MSKKMMSFLVESSDKRKSGRRALGSFATSFLLQGIALAIMIVVPLMATDNLPSPQGILKFMTPPPPVVRVIPQPASPKSSRPAVTRPVLGNTLELIAPINVPDEIGEGIDFFAPAGVPSDIPGGVLTNIAVGIPSLPPPPSRQEPVRVGGDIKSPRKIHDVVPAYPDIARQARVEGVVILEAIIDPQGNVTHLRVLRPIPLLEKAAIEAVRQWKYEPTLLNAVPVPIVMTVTVVFRLQ